MTNCEAKYGDRKCENEATKTVISQGQMFSLCKGCAQLVTRQNRANGR